MNDSKNGSNSSGAQQPVARPTAANVQGTFQRTQHDNQSSGFSFERAIKRDAKLRLAVVGPSGSGKTYTLLKLATELGGPVALVDTERGSAEKYADEFAFDTLQLTSFNPDYIPSLIDTATRQGYQTLIIDSLSHFWMGVDGELDLVERAKIRLRDNSFAAWRDVTPKHNRMIDAMLGAPLHLLVSMRVKTEWVVEKDDQGKAKPRKVGLQPVMREGIEYEFDVFGEMDYENRLFVSKTRCPQLLDGIFPKPGREFAAVLKEWLRVGDSESGSEPEVTTQRHQIASLPPPPVVVVPASVSAEPPPVLRHSAVPAILRPAIPDDIASMWKRMCSPRRVTEEFERLKRIIEETAGSTGISEYCRILREFGADRPQNLKTTQTARLCAKRVHELIEELRSRQNDAAGALPASEVDTLAARNGMEVCHAG